MGTVLSSAPAVRACTINSWADTTDRTRKVAHAAGHPPHPGSVHPPATGALVTYSFRLTPRWAAAGRFVGPPTGIGLALFAAGPAVLTLLKCFVRSVNAHSVQLRRVVRVAVDSDGEVVIRPTAQA